MSQTRPDNFALERTRFARRSPQRYAKSSALLKLIVLASVFVLVLNSTGATDDFGLFVGRVVTEWLEDGRRMRLLEDFSYVDPAKSRWDAPAGTIVDGASVPQFAWSVIGGPFEGRYRNASVIHDVACDSRSRPWPDAHRAFYTAMLASGVDPVKARIMYAAVYHFGPRWAREVSVPNVPLGAGRGTAASIASSARKGERPLVEIRPGPPTPRPCPDCAFPLPPFPPKTEDVRVTFTPSPRVLSRDDFDTLRSAIEMGGPISLTDIEDFKPAPTSK